MLLVAGASCSIANAADSEVKREVVFLVDVSASMPSALGGGRFASFEGVVEAARIKAGSMLGPFEGDESVTVSFYRFGNIQEDGQGGWKPDLRAVAKGVPVSEAIAGLDEYFPADSEVYSDGWTYVAASVYDIAYERLDMGDPCDTIRPSEGKPHLLIFALTDQGEDGGGESSPSCRQDDGRCSWDTENARRKAWLERQQLTNALSYTHWDMGNDNIQLIPPDEAVYRVQWVSKLKGQYNLADPELDVTPRLGDFEPRIRLVPEATRPNPAFLDDNPELICEPRQVDKLRATAASRSTVDIQPAWSTDSGALGRDPLDGLEIVLAPRELRSLGRAIELDVLRADFEGLLELPIPVNQKLSLGQHALGVTKESLCEALTDAYPNSTFILPPDLEGIQLKLGNDCELPPKQGAYDLARIGSVALVDRARLPTYTFELSSDGVPVNGPVSFDIDRWWRARPDQTTTGDVQERQVRLSYQDAAGQPAYHAKYELHLERDGATVEHYFDDVLSFGDGRTVLDDVPANEPVTILLPGRGQRWWRRGKDFPTGGRHGDYTAQLCVEPDVADSELYNVEVSCSDQDCIEGPEAISMDGHEICVPFAVEVGRRPFFSWWRIGIIALVLAAIGWVAICWIRRKRFHPSLVVGSSGCRLRWEQEQNRTHQPGRLVYSLVHSLKLPPAGPWFYIDISHSLFGKVNGLEEKPQTTTPMLGIRALPDGAFVVWLVRPPVAPKDPGADPGETDRPRQALEPYKLFIKHHGPKRELTPQGARPDPLARKTGSRVRLSSSRDRAVLTLEHGGEELFDLVFRLEPTSRSRN